jgi:hypothetical protein
MRKDPQTTDHGARRWSVGMMIMWLAFVFLCCVLAVGVQRLVEQQPDLSSRIWPAQAGGEPPAR